MGAKNDEITSLVQSELAVWFAAERKKLQETAERYKAALEAAIAERNKAKKEYPGLLKEVEAKKKLLESLPSEISELEGRLFAAERSKDDDETGPFSSIKRARDAYERAEWEAKSFVSNKLNEMKQIVQG
jgi:chromosome segregation ATPase